MLNKFDNGLKVILQENHSAPVVALQVWVQVGSADDPDDLSGLAHVVEHMVFKGTARRGEGQIAKEIEGAGGQINAWTAFDQTVFHVVLPSRYWARGLDILADAMQNARFEQKDLNRELLVIREEINQGEDSPSKVVARELFGAAYRKHPYGRPVIGRLQSVQKIRTQQIHRFFQKWYNPTNMTLVVVGDVDSKEVIKRANQLFSSSAVEVPKILRTPEPMQKNMRVVVKYRALQEAYLSFAFHVPALMDPDTPALDLAAIVLGQGDSSRLVRRVKREQQLVTDIYAYSYTPKDPGIMVVGATTTPDKVSQAISAIAAQVFNFSSSEVTAEELRRAKIIVESDAVYQKETVQGQARKLGFFHSVAGSIEFEQEYNRRIAEITPAQIRQAARQYLKPENLTLAVLDPQSQSKEKEKIADFTASIEAARTETLSMDKPIVEDAPRITKMTLRNGARLLIMRDDTVPLVAMRAVWNGGLRYEAPNNNGINNLLAGLITRGTTSRSGDQINEAVENMAGSIGGFSGQNSFGIRAEMLARHWEQGLELLADCLLNPVFKEAEVERERRQVLDDIRAEQDNLGTMAFQLFNRTLYRQHPYRLNSLGTIDSISSLTRQRLIQYYRRFFRPSSMVLAIVGDIDVERVKEKFKQLFGYGVKQTLRPIEIKPESFRNKPEDAYLFTNKQQVHLAIGYPGATLRSRERYPLEVLASLLSGQGGRLFVELRDRLGLAYQIGASSQEGIEPGSFTVYVATSPEKVPAVLAGIETEIRRLKERPISAAELKRVQQFLVGNYEISLQRKSTVAALLAFNECYGLGYQAYTKYRDLIMSVTTEELTQIARKYFDDNKRIVAIVKPEEATPGVIKQQGELKQAGVVRGGANISSSPPTTTSRNKRKLKQHKR